MSAYVVTCSGPLGVRGEDGWYCYRSQEDADGDPDGSGAALVIERQGESS